MTLRPFVLYAAGQYESWLEACRYDQAKGGVDYIPAIRNEQDFRNVDREEWLRLFEAILEKVFMRSFFWILGTVSTDFIRYWKIAEEFIHRILTRESQRQS